MHVDVKIFRPLESITNINYIEGLRGFKSYDEKDIVPMRNGGGIIERNRGCL